MVYTKVNYQFNRDIEINCNIDGFKSKEYT